MLHVHTKFRYTSGQSIVLSDHRIFQLRIGEDIGYHVAQQLIKLYYLLYSINSRAITLFLKTAKSSTSQAIHLLLEQG